MADDHDARQVQAEDEQYKDFLATGYPSLLTWVAHLLDKEAVNGGRHLDLSFDHWAGRVDGIGSGLMRAGDYFKALESRQYSLPFSRTAIRIEVLADKLAGAVADHFRKLGFDVNVRRLGSIPSRRRGATIAPSTEVSISWSAMTKTPIGSDELMSSNKVSSRSPIQAVRSIPAACREPSYQTAPLVEYDYRLQKVAASLFQRVEERVGRTRAKAYKGSYSILAPIGGQTAVKIIIFEDGLGKINGDWPQLANGVYVLIRVDGPVGEPLWREFLEIEESLDRTRTIGIAPNHRERFAYFNASGQYDEERIADLIAKCAKIVDSGHT